MSLIRRNNMLFPTLMNELLKPDWFGGIENLNTALPAVNIKENEKDFELALSVPGRKKEDFNIEIDNELLTISSEVKIEDDKVKENFTRREFGAKSFKRSFNLPETVDNGKIDASYLDGILRLKLPKRKEALPKPKRLIKLS